MTSDLQTNDQQTNDQRTADAEAAPAPAPPKKMAAAKRARNSARAASDFGECIADSSRGLDFEPTIRA